MTTLTLVSPPAKTQNFELNARPSTTLITISTLLEEKNQKYPVSLVRATACPAPLVRAESSPGPPPVLLGALYWVWTLKRLPLAQNVVALATQGAPAPG